MVKIPSDFEKCVKNGGKVVTKKLKGNKYIHVCYDKNGKSYTGEVKTKKKSKAFYGNNYKKKIKESRVLAKDLLRLKKHFDDNYRVDKAND